MDRRTFLGLLGAVVVAPKVLVPDPEQLFAAPPVMPTSNVTKTGVARVSVAMDSVEISAPMSVAEARRRLSKVLNIQPDLPAFVSKNGTKKPFQVKHEASFILQPGDRLEFLKTMGYKGCHKSCPQYNTCELENGG
jgi:hypothetical protein